MMRWSLATVCLGGGLETKLAAAAKAGFRAVEIFENDLTFFPGKARDARRIASDLGLEIVALQPLRDFEGAPEPQRRRNFNRAERKLELTRELGAPLLCLCSSVAEDGSGEAERIAADLAELADLARQYGLKLGYEALSWGRHVKDWTHAWDLVAKADRANLGIVLDSFHICARGLPIEPIAALPADRIALVQVADSPALQMDLLSLSRHYRCYPGQGDYPIVEYLDAVARAGYRGPISLEIFNEQFRGASAAGIAVDGMRSLLASGEALAKRGADAVPSPAPGARGAAPGILWSSQRPKRTPPISPICSRGWDLRTSARIAAKPSISTRKATSAFVRQPRERVFRARLSNVARRFRLRPDLESRQRRAGDRAGAGDGMSGACRPYRPGRSADSRRRRRRGQSHLFRRRQRRRLAQAISSLKPTRRPVRSRASTISPTWSGAANS